MFGLNMADQYRAVAMCYWNCALEKAKIDFSFCCGNDESAGLHNCILGKVLQEWTLWLDQQRHSQAQRNAMMAPSTPPRDLADKPPAFKQNTPAALASQFSQAGSCPATAAQRPAQLQTAASSPFAIHSPIAAPATPSSGTYTSTSQVGSNLQGQSNYSSPNLSHGSNRQPAPCSSSSSSSSTLGSCLQKANSVLTHSSASSRASTSSGSPESPYYLSHCGKEGMDRVGATLHLDAYGAWVYDDHTSYKTKAQGSAKPLIPAFISRDGKTGRGTRRCFLHLTGNDTWAYDK